jgi:hypothetical protein
LNCGHEKDGQVGYVMLGATDEIICTPCHSLRRQAAYTPKVLRRERRGLEASMGFCTTVGTILRPVDIKRKRLLGDAFPLSDGNCCDLLNMYSENAEEALKRWPELRQDCEVEIVEWNGRECVRVVDARIPRHWFHHDCDICGVYEVVGGGR